MTFVRHKDSLNSNSLDLSAIVHWDAKAKQNSRFPKNMQIHLKYSRSNTKTGNFIHSLFTAANMIIQQNSYILNLNSRVSVAFSRFSALNEGSKASTNVW